MHHPTSFYTKTNPRENGLFASELAVGERKATHNVKIHAIYFIFYQSPPFYKLRGVFILVLHHKDKKLLSIYGNFGWQNDFIVA